MENTKRRNATLFRIAAVILMFTLVTSCFASSTFAKYTSQANGTAKVQVAKWLIEAGKDSANKEDIYVANGTAKTINLAATVVDTEASNVGNPDTDVAAGAQNVAKIAPGTKGTFDLYVNNASEVNAQYKFAIDKSSLPATLRDKLAFAYKVGDTPVSENTFRSLPMSGTTDETVTVEWVWPYNVSDAENLTDTTLGHDNYASQYDLIITLTVEQVD